MRTHVFMYMLIHVTRIRICALGRGTIKLALLNRSTKDITYKRADSPPQRMEDSQFPQARGVAAKYLVHVLWMMTFHKRLGHDVPPVPAEETATRVIRFNGNP